MDKIGPEFVVGVLSGLIGTLGMVLHHIGSDVDGDKPLFHAFAGMCYFVAASGFAFFAGINHAPSFLCATVLLLILGMHLFRKLTHSLIFYARMSNTIES